MKKIYISGPMTDYDDFNYPAFNAAAAALAANGWLPLNPACNFGGNQGLPLEEYMKMDLQHILMADAIYLLPGWEHSKGANVELTVARAIGLPVFAADNGIPEDLEDEPCTIPD